MLAQLATFPSPTHHILLLAAYIHATLQDGSSKTADEHGPAGTDSLSGASEVRRRGGGGGAGGGGGGGRTHGRGGVLAKTVGEGGVGDERNGSSAVGSRVGGAARIGVERAHLVCADALELRALGGDNGGRGRAAVVEELLQRGADSSDVGRGDTERGGREADLLDKVTDLVGVQVHVLVHTVLRGVAGVGGEALGGAAEEDTEVLVEVGEEGADGR